MIYIREKEEIIRNKNWTTEYSRAFFRHQKRYGDKLIVYGSGQSKHGFLMKQDDEKLYGFGKNHVQQLGIGNTKDRVGLTEIPFFNSQKKATKVSCGWNHSIFLNSKNEVYASGSNMYGQSGFNFDNPPIISQEGNLITCILVRIYNPRSNKTVKIVDVFAGGYHSVVLSTSLEVYSFGSNWAGELGTGDNDQRKKATKIEIAEKIISISCGLNHTCFLSINGNLYVTGRNDYGQLGDNSKVNVNKPKKLSFFEGKKIMQISCGENFNVCLTSESVFSWGKNRCGVLGIGNSKKQKIPVLVSSLKDKKIVCVKLGANHGCFVSENGIWLGGKNENGQLGTKDYENVYYPMLFSIQGKKIIQSLILCDSSIHFTKKEVYGAGSNTSGEFFCGKTKDERQEKNKVLKIHDLKVKRRGNLLNLNEILDRFEFLLKTDKKSWVCLC